MTIEEFVTIPNRIDNYYIGYGCDDDCSNGYGESYRGDGNGKAKGKGCDGGNYNYGYGMCDSEYGYYAGSGIGKVKVII